MILILVNIKCRWLCFKRKGKKKKRDAKNEEEITGLNEQYFNKVMKGKDIKSISEYTVQEKKKQKTSKGYEDERAEYYNQASQGKDVKRISQYKNKT